MEIVALGYEKVDKYTHIFDVIVEEKEGRFKLVLPKLPDVDFGFSDINYIDTLYYREPGETGAGSVRPVKIDSDGREYVAVELGVMRDTVVYRIVTFNSTENKYIVRLRVDERVMSMERKESNGVLFYTEGNELELEEEFIENIQKEVTIVGVTKYDETGKGHDIERRLNKYLEGDFLGSIIKESGDSEIALAVLKQG